MTVQKRQHERYRIALVVTYPREGEVAAGRSRDISLGGMFVETEHQLPYGTRVVMDVAIPLLPEPAQIEVTVRWTATDGMGVQFGTLRAREAWAINQLGKPGSQGL